MRETRWTLFHKMLLIIVLLLIPIVLLYSYSNFVSVNVVRDGIRESLVSRLSFLENRLNTQVNHMSRSGFLLSEDPSLSSVDTLDSFKNYFDVIQFKQQLMARIAVQSNTMEWPMTIAVYFPASRQVLSPAATPDYDEEYLKKHVTNHWMAGEPADKRPGRFDFYFYAVSPFSAYYHPAGADNIVEIRFSDGSLIGMLDDYKQSAQGEPFLYHAGDGVIVNGTADRKAVDQVVRELERRPAQEQDSFTVRLNGESYLVNSIRSQALEWTLVDFVPMQHVLLPMRQSTRLFYFSIGALLVVGVIAAFLLYRHVQVPLLTLVRSLQKVKRGDFSTRISSRPGREFRFVFQQFNEMTRQIGELIDHVYRQKLATRDAQLKQLQSQINPHFLYNCLYYIVNMVRLGKEEGIERMAMNLGDYFRYTTRLEKQNAALSEEIGLIVNYLEIQNLRMTRIRYAIDIPEEILDLEVPRLLLQPVVENAVVHGIEPKVGGGHIRIAGSRTGDRVEVVVEDDGVGVADDELAELNRQLGRPMQEDMGYGIWNVNQRLIMSFGDKSGVRYEKAPHGGMRVRLVWHTGE
ncbi:sensor histidine kinase [Cohnella zeiphila]|uniref:Sensor histidine kinase n=1 Tax=Cohnella zeiphila TaxID=2761120 RepID=A0A7X0SGJ9_9BACL|nr:sensor histidine kinase [Cohnella zeiphila]MBB6729574.1 sensor histidine kinase [Cohnella zeiphila]